MTTQYKDTCLHDAVRYSDIDEVRSALRAGYDPNQIGLYQWSPLHEAANNGDVDIVRLLLRFKGDPNLRDILQGCTAVHYASKGDHNECLKLLLSAGGRYDVINNDGESCLDVARGDCIHLLQQQRKQDTISTSPPLSPQITSGSPPKYVEDQEPEISPLLHRGHSSLSEESDLFDVNSIDSSPTSSEVNFKRTWSVTSQIKRRDLALGHIELSFEYNSKKKSMKIRVWQVHGLIMPPAEQSMVSGIYVKSYILPEDKKDTKRRTEELSVYKSEKADSKKPESAKRRGSSHLVVKKSNESFNPQSFSFEKPLEYTNISQDVITKKYIDIHVAVTQRYSRRSYVVATWNMPLKLATRKLVREKFQLKAVLGGNIPDNMRVYGANELSGRGQIRNAYSNPNIRCPSVSSLSISEANERASSDLDLKQVVMHTQERPSSFILSLPEEDDTSAELEQIAVSVHQESPDMRVPMPEEDDRDVDRHVSVPEVKIQNVRKTRRNSGRSRYSSTESETDLDLITNKKTSKKIPKDKNVEKGQKLPKSTRSSSLKGLKPEMASFSSLNENTHESPRRSKGQREHKADHSRPGTPEWDYFMEPLSISMVSPELMDDNFDLCLLEPNEPVLPILTTMSLPTQESKLNEDVNINNMRTAHPKKASEKEKSNFNNISKPTPQESTKNSITKQRRRSSNRPDMPITEL